MRISFALISIVIVFHAISEGQEKNPMIYIPPGEFIMGTSEEEAKKLAEEYNVHPTLFQIECPKRKVNLPGFYIDRFPVTNAEYKEFIDATGQRPPAGWNGTDFPEGQGDYPVTDVNWTAAAAYAKWAGKRLPTDAEWEKAARGTDGRIYPWGNEWDDATCLTDDLKCPQTKPRTTRVGCFARGASPYGVMDMVGDVAEWTSTETCPPDPKKKWAWYVVKGAANCHRMKFNFRCASRAFSAHLSRRHDWLGFRCAKDAPEPPAEVTAPQPISPRPIPTFPKSNPPDESAFGKEPIKITASTGHSARYFVPHFPEGPFSTNLPEQVGAAGHPFDWNALKTPIKWTVAPDGTSAEYQCTWDGLATLRVNLHSGLDYVDFTITIKNLTEKTFKGVGTNTCFNNSVAVYFIDPERTRTMVWTDDGPVRLLEMPISGRGEPLHGGWRVARADEKAPKGGSFVRLPFIFIVSRDGNWVVAEAYDESTSVGSNAHYSCLHSRPVWPDIPPGEERSRTGKLYFLKGGPNELLERWKKDFGR